MNPSFQDYLKSYILKHFCNTEEHTLMYYILYLNEMRIAHAVWWLCSGLDEWKSRVRFPAEAQICLFSTVSTPA
jgi:hypothetical protein